MYGGQLPAATHVTEAVAGGGKRSWQQVAAEVGRTEAEPVARWGLVAGGTEAAGA